MLSDPSPHSGILFVFCFVFNRLSCNLAFNLAFRGALSVVGNLVFSLVFSVSSLSACSLVVVQSLVVMLRGCCEDVFDEARRVMRESHAKKQAAFEKLTNLYNKN